MLPPESFKISLSALKPRLDRFALALTGSPTDAEEVAQQTATVALEKWEQYDTSRPLDRWLFTILRNIWLDEIRQRKTRYGNGIIQADELVEVVVENPAIDAIQTEDVLRHVSDLPSELSVPLLLIAVEGYSYAEVSSLLELPVGTVMSRVYRARQKLVVATSVDDVS